jgi:release factor glutamine methyltransferase
MDSPPSVDASLRAAAARLQGRVASPGAEAEELLGRLLGVSRSQLLMARERPLPEPEARRLDRWLARRLAGEPIQYITGRAAFRGLDLAVAPGVLIPRPETEGLVEAVLRELSAESKRWPAPRVLELGTGSGAIALAIAQEHPAAAVTATDVSPDALEVASTNAAALGLSAAVRFLRGDWFEPIEQDERFEAVVSNPPYIATSEWDDLPHDVRAHEPAQALFSGATGLEALREIVDQAPHHLVASGLLAIEVAESRALEVEAWLEGSRDWERVSLLEDLAGRPRVLLARRQSGPAIAPAQWGEDR